MKKPDTKTHKNTITGRITTYKRGSCHCCKSCWIEINSGECELTGPFDGYMDDEGKIYILRKEVNALDSQ